MKYIYPVTALLLCLFSSCDKSSDAPELIKRLPVDRVFKTVILPVKLSETNDWDDHYTLDTTFKKIKDSEYENGAVENLSYIRSALLVTRIHFDSRISWSYQVKE